MADETQPSRDPSNDDELSGAFAEILYKFLANSIDDMLPGIVEVYDKETNRVKVKPLIQVLDTDGGLTDRGVIQSIPVFQLGGGDYGLFFNNIKEGDLGWIKASDRDISLFLQSYKQAGPNTKRFHQFSDAVFFPDVMRNYDIQSGEHVVLQKIDGTKRVAITDDEVRIVSDVDVDITATADINLTSGNEININSGTVNIGSKVNLGSGGQPIARQGDAVLVNVVGGSSSGPAVGTITAGSPNHTAN